MLNSYLGLNFGDTEKASKSRYGNGKYKRLVNLSLNAFFSNFKLTTVSGRDFEDICHAHLVSLLCKLKTSNRGSHDLSTGFDRDGDRRRHELGFNKNIKGKYHIRIMLKDVFGFAEHQKKLFMASVIN